MLRRGTSVRKSTTTRRMVQNVREAGFMEKKDLRENLINQAPQCYEIEVGFSLFDNLNIEYRTRNFEQQKLLKGIRRCFLLRYSAVPCSAVLLFIFSMT
jgi:hypothetical protein